MLYSGRKMVRAKFDRVQSGDSDRPGKRGLTGLRAMRLPPGTWARIKGSDELVVVEAVHVIHTLYAAANGTSKVATEGLGLLDSLAPTLISGMVQDVNVHKRSRGVSADARLVPGLASAMCGTVVREAQCGCGSGRAYYNRCGAH